MGRQILYSFGFHSPVKQGWGWHRSLDEMLEIIFSIGLEVITVIDSETQTILIIEKFDLKA